MYESYNFGCVRISLSHKYLLFEISLLGLQLCHSGALGCDDNTCQLICKLPWHGCELGVCGGGRCQCSHCHMSKNKVIYVSEFLRIVASKLHCKSYQKWFLVKYFDLATMMLSFQ